MNQKDDNRLGTVEVIRRIGISSERLRYWEYVGIVQPQYIQCGTRRFRRYSIDDVKRSLYVKKLIEEDKYSLEGARIKLQQWLEGSN